MILRPAKPQDAKALATLGRESFCAKFAHLYDPADLNAFLKEVYSVEAVSGELADPQLTHRLAVDDEDTLIGFIKLKDPSGYGKYSDATKPIGLQQLYCAPDRTGEGIGAALTDWALAEARARGCDAIQLSVYSDNDGAQRFYQRYGFAKIADIYFMVGNHRDDEYLYELRL
ncbi:GNAT family N-acetyltransferase [Aurantiacibacter sediminis]|uniref:GNAT family N-acetyltransferase n=1 Tax=Aurantiacibacter sediminis TaxID=2793064 RepID=A0ABS0MZ50_9SPHN|nr:GNAT family N-acetyltransferase [Aurantiacibacter sediminis]MBH5320992.1 GNAT family N-acetyltransferase [Aurantiacibacter sediminis]